MQLGSHYKYKTSFCGCGSSVSILSSEPLKCSSDWLHVCFRMWLAADARVKSSKVLSCCQFLTCRVWKLIYDLIHIFRVPLFVVVPFCDFPHTLRPLWELFSSFLPKSWNSDPVYYWGLSNEICLGSKGMEKEREKSKDSLFTLWHIEALWGGRRIFSQSFRCLHSNYGAGLQLHGWDFSGART